VKTFPETFVEYNQWLTDSGYVGIDATGAPIASAFVTCGDWDLKTMLPCQVCVCVCVCVWLFIVVFNSLRGLTDRSLVVCVGMCVCGVLVVWCVYVVFVICSVLSCVL